MARQQERPDLFAASLLSATVASAFSLLTA